MPKDELQPRSKALREALEWARLHEGEQDLLTVRQACRRLMISRTTLYKLMNSGKLPSVKIGTRRLIPVRAIPRLIDLLEQKGGLKKMENEVRSEGGNALLSIAQACDQLGVSKSTLTRLIGERKIESVKIGRRRLIPESGIARYVASLETESGF